MTIDDVDTSSRNLLSNPAHAFDFIGTQYAPSLVSDAEGRAVVRLTPTSADASPAGEILVTVDTAAMRPVSLRYDYDGEQVGIVRVEDALRLSMATGANVVECPGLGDFAKVDEYKKHIEVRQVC